MSYDARKCPYGCGETFAANKLASHLRGCTATEREQRRLTGQWGESADV